MAFPVVEDRLTQNVASGTNHNVNMPAVVNKGDVLVAWVAYSSNVGFTPPTGWKTIGSNLGSTWPSRLCSYVATGTEGGTTQNFTTSSSTTMAVILYRISGALAPYLRPALAAFLGPNPNPPSVTVWDSVSRDTLWLCGTHGDSFEPSAPPTNYTNLTTLAGVSNGKLGMAERNVAAATEDPGAFTMTNDGGDVFTLAVPSRADGPYLVDYQLFSYGASAFTVTPSDLYKIADGDVLLVWVNNSAAASITNPAGWTNIFTSGANSVQRHLTNKIASSESGTYIFSWSGSTIGRAAFLIIRGAKSGDEIDAHASAQLVSSSSTTITVSSFNTAADGSLFGFAGERSGDAWGTQPTGFLEIFPVLPTNSNGHGGAYKESQPAGATGDIIFTRSGSGAVTLNAIVVGIKSEAVGGVSFIGWGGIPI